MGSGPQPCPVSNSHSIVKGFMGQTTAFNKQVYQAWDPWILGENKALNSAKIQSWQYGIRNLDFLGGHDPEDYQAFVGDSHLI